MLINYIIDQINAHISRMMVDKENQYVNITVCGIITSSNFWFFSNLGVFFTNGIYTSDTFKDTFKIALPFYKYNLLSTLIFNLAFYGLHTLVVYMKEKNSYKKKIEDSLIINESLAALQDNENQA